MSIKLYKTYKDYVLSHEKQPSSVYLFCKENKLKEVDFYKHFNSFEALEQEWLKSFFVEVVEILHKDKEFENYTSREQILALFYAWTEKAVEERSFLSYISHRSSIKEQMGLGAARLPFNEFVKLVLDRAIDRKEIMERKFISDKYYHALWTQFLLIHSYWIKDSSKGFEKTDAFIEKSTNLAFDLMGQSALDSALDLAKFVFQK